MDSTDESSASSSCPSSAPSGPSPKLPSSQYKGVVPQPNGRWGAQIYEKHQRVWLGTFNLERDAARAYDAAAQRFRGRDAATNFPPLPPSSPELSFLLSRSKSEVVDMLRKHTYLDELLHHRRLLPLYSPSPSSSLPRDHLFDKAVTPSDVGKLNRLVIPKQHAERHFPIAAPDAAAAGLLLAFEDPAGKLWRFRYSYWNSSQSYVLTKGWSRFVKEKGLKPGDSVGFYRARQPGGQLYIDCRVRPAPAPVKPVRLFGVDLVNAGDSDGKRRLDSPLPQQLGWFKKQCVVGV